MRVVQRSQRALQVWVAELAEADVHVITQQRRNVFFEALECTPLVRTHSDGWREQAAQRRAVLECVGRWDGAEGEQGELRWAGRTPKERSEQRRIFTAVQQRLWDPL